MKITLLILIMAFAGSCSNFLSKKDKIQSDNSITKPKKRFEPNTDKRIRKSATEKPLFGNSQKQDTFGNNNLLWQATMQTLSSLPILSASYQGGLISTDWYGNSEEQIRLNVSFNSNEIRPTSFQVVSFKKICKSNNNCSVSKGSEQFNQQIKNKIIEQVKNIKIANN